jgi:hypothetical protein
MASFWAWAAVAHIKVMMIAIRAGNDLHLIGVSNLGL